MFTFINDDAHLIERLQSGTFIHVLNNGQMMLANDSGVRLDIVMVYDLINRGLLRIVERNRIVLADEGEGMTLLQITGEIQEFLTRFEQDLTINRLLTAGSAFYRPKVLAKGTQICIWYRKVLFQKPYRLSRAHALLYLTRLKSGWIREHWWPADETAYWKE